MSTLSTQEVSLPSVRVEGNTFVLPVTSVQHYTDRLFSFRVMRPTEFRFRSGEFAMIGLPDIEPSVFRAYSIASPSWDDELEFYSIKVPDGPLTKNLQKITVGDNIVMRKKSTGTLVNDALIPGNRLFMFSTGTGMAPFASLVRDPETFEKFDQIIITHTCREVGELKYGLDLFSKIKSDPLIGELTEGKLSYYATTTREGFHHMGRITDLLASGKMFDDLKIEPINPATDRAMICGSMDMIRDTKQILEGFGLEEGANNRPASYVIERAFVG